MKKKIFLGLLIFILIALPLVLICNGKATFPTLSVASAADASHGNDWWRQYGEPKYGGTLIYQKASVQPDLGPYTNWGGLYGCYLETLWKPSWTTSREEWPFTTTFTPGEYFDGMLAESWDQTDPQTLMIHLRKGIHWQDKEPVNGREFVANDVQEHYDRILGKGKYTKPCPLYAPRLGMWKKVTALDKYTVEFKFSYPSAQTFLSVVEQAGQNYIEAPEWMALSESERNDWRKAVGTGPWILTDYIDGSSITYSKNPNYWDYDERHPDNRVPYADELKVLMISDSSTAIAAMRTGKLDLIDELTWLQAKFLADRNPELRKVRIPAFGAGIQPRVDHEPFTDIRVRKALQMAIDRKAIAKSHFGGTIDGIPSGVVNPEYKGYAFAYKDWSDELKAEYSYNPERAKELLAEAGYPDGFKTNIVAGGNNDLELMQILKAQFLDIGVDMEIKVMEGVAAMSFIRAKQHDQISPGSCARTFNPQMCIAAYNTNDFANYGCISDPDYDALYKRFINSNDPAEARRLVKEADRYGLEKHWTVILFPTYRYNIYQQYLKGYSGELISIVGGVNGASGWMWARLWKENR